MRERENERERMREREREKEREILKIDSYYNLGRLCRAVNKA